MHEVRQHVETELGLALSDNLRTELLAMIKAVSDVYITRANGDRVDDEKEANRKLAVLKSELYRELTGN